MNRSAKAVMFVLAMALFAVIGSSAFAVEAEQVVVPQGALTRAEVQAEASTVSSTRNFHPAGSDVLPPMASTVDRSTVHAQAVERARSADAHRGEATMM